MSNVRTAEISLWREARPNGGWSDTLYKGLLIRGAGDEGNDLLVAKLSHGWRVIEVTDPSKIQFALKPVEEVDLPQSLQWEIGRFLEADVEFQHGPGALLDKLMGG